MGVGWYPIDIHRSGPDDVGASCRTKPFQIPLGALLPVRVGNLIAAAKNIGTTHITNGCYRLHPIEWNIGEAAGELAALALEQRVAPAAVHGSADLLARLQRRLVAQGVPLAWLTDVGGDDVGESVLIRGFRDPIEARTHAASGVCRTPNSLASALVSNTDSYVSWAASSESSAGGMPSTDSPGETWRTAMGCPRASCAAAMFRRIRG